MTQNIHSQPFTGTNSKPDRERHKHERGIRFGRIGEAGKVTDIDPAADRINEREFCVQAVVPRLLVLHRQRAEFVGDPPTRVF